MGNHHRGQIEFAVQPPVILAKRVARQRIERAERLVHQYDGRLRSQRPRHADPLALAAGKLVRKALAIACTIELHEIEQFVDTGGDLRPGFTEQAGRDADIAGDAHMRKQATALKYISDAPSQRDRIEVSYVLAIDPDRAVVGLDQPVGKAKQRGLA